MEIFSITQNDWKEHCECEQCTELALKYSDDGKPRWSAPILVAVNELARRIKAWQSTDERVKNRKIILQTFEYSYTVEPPVGLRAEDNVMIEICSHEACFKHKISDKSCPVNAKFCEQLEKWKKIAKNIYIWDYADNFVFEIAFNTIWENVADNVRYFADVGAVGMFEQFGGDDMCGMFPEVRQYMFAKLLWNPYLDFKKEYEEAMEYLYKDAAPFVMQVEEEFCKNTDKIKDFHPRASYTIYKEHYSEEFLSKATELFEKALSVSTDSEVTLRIRKDYMALKWVKMYLNKGKNYEEMKEVIDELKELGITFPKLRLFIDHYFNGKTDDLFLENIEARNKSDWQLRFEVAK